MSSSANPQHEPTMEEILASIRKIISEDQPDGAKPTAEPTPVRAAAAEAQPHVESEILELTEEVEEVEEEAVTEAPPAETPAPIDDDIAFENVEAEPKAEPAMDTDDLISDTARSAVDRAFAKLDAATAPKAKPKPQPQVSTGTLDALFTKAVQDAFAPTLQDWVDNHHAEIMDSLKPVIRDWMDANLPNLIEAAVTKEISRAAAERPRRR
jgi:cell pole-organizing protein PopZ